MVGLRNASRKERPGAASFRWRKAVAWLAAGHLALPLAGCGGAPPKPKAPPARPAGFALDPSFGEGGTAPVKAPVSPSGRCSGALEDLAVAPDGSIYLLATMPSPGDPKLEGCDASVIRLTPSGSVDASFGAEGVVRAGRAYGRGAAIAIGKDGVFVAVNYIAKDTRGTPDTSPELRLGGATKPANELKALSNAAVAVVKLDLRGVPVASFGDKGEAHLREREALVAQALEADEGGGVTVVGVQRTLALVPPTNEVLPRTGRLFVARLTPKGARDAKAPGKGLALSPPKAPLVRQYVGRGAEGGFVAAVGAQGLESLVRLGESLALDSAYGDQGAAPFALPDGGLYSFAASPSGAVTVSGLGDDGDATLTRFAPEGSLASRPGSKGSVVTGPSLSGAARFERVSPLPGVVLAPRADGAVFALATLVTGRESALLVGPSGAIDAAVDHVSVAPPADALPAGRSLFDAKGRLLVPRERSGAGVLLVSRYVLPPASR